MDWRLWAQWRDVHQKEGECIISFLRNIIQWVCKCVCMCVYKCEVNGDIGFSLFPISPQSGDPLIQFHPSPSFHPHFQLIVVSDHYHMHVGTLTRFCVCVHVHVRTHECVYTPVSRGQGDVRTSPAIKTLTPDLVSDHQIAKCFPYGSFHIGSHICPESSSSFHPRNTMTQSAQINDLKTFNVFQVSLTE